ncbi:Glycosyltransferase involved in cell wall bisynthesis [Algoriphagus locisalis]|uniref:Glycosyltransferase involved in cell wall bisynthesis n=1 Tax=Algoriphagus locisalis TaxID=305507 RepID=A0A1I6Y5U8_9BACT|nr:glycosyltransferase [Algoriphagus locisalis]SFT45621.1 Glycosyltransferase involved in cell wall bisynthesis [Algoriphagus locisalis]
MKDKILFYTSFPKPITGQTIVTQKVWDLLYNDPRFVCFKINTSSSTIVKKFFTFISNYFLLVKFLILVKPRFVYMVFSSSKLGCVRDFFSIFIISLFSNVKLISHVHSGNFGLEFLNFPFNLMLKYNLERVTTIIFQGKQVNFLGSKYDYKIKYLMNTISSEFSISDNEFKEVSCLRKKNFENSGKIKLFFLSNFIISKGYLDLFDSYELLDIDVFDKFELHFIGFWFDDRSKSEFLNKVTKSSRSNCIFVHEGLSDRLDVKKLLVEMDVFIFPTYYPVESQPLSILESFSLGIPVVSTYHATIPEMIEDGYNGYLFEKRDHNQLLNIMRGLVNYEIIEYLSLNARDSFNKRFSEKEFESKFIQLLYA